MHHASLSSSSSFSSPSKSSLRGQWKLFANPYCTTDRYYDELSLQSYPLQQVLFKGKMNNDDGKNNHPKLLQSTLQLSMNCRMWGHYRNRHRYRPKQQQQPPHFSMDCRSTSVYRPLYGKLTHGTVALLSHRQDDDTYIVKANKGKTDKENNEGQKKSPILSDDKKKHTLQRPITTSFLRKSLVFPFRPVMVIASFTAVRISKEPSHEGWIDQHYFRCY